MTSLIGNIVDSAAAGGLLALLGASALKGTIVLLLAGIAVVVFRRASASMRHVIWSAAIASFIVIPLASITLPHWSVLEVSVGWLATVVGSPGETPRETLSSRFDELRQPTTVVLSEQRSSQATSPPSMSPKSAEVA